jgi:hypothetical protein
MSTTTLSRLTATTVPLDDLSLVAEIALGEALLEQRGERIVARGAQVCLVHKLGFQTSFFSAVSPPRGRVE